ncbi:MAG TPA: hypothetical protein VJ739_02120 [Gemmataceae bacterium]|nr:hypothetical protein [Gemmataceae bacterium]
MWRNIGRWVAGGALVAAVVLGGLEGIPTAARAQAGSRGDGTAVLKADMRATKYLCQKYYYGCWHTVYTTYSYEDAMDWYDRQPGNARVIAQK